MEEKRLDFNVPLLSVRRNASTASPTRKPPVPLYNPESKTRAVGNAGLVPFTWEQTPGKPKSTALARPPVAPKPPPGRILIETGSDEYKKVEKETDESDTFFDTLSRQNSLDCSVSGYGGITDAVEDSRNFSKDPEVSEFMMGRFLPAAKAMATGPLQTAPAKETRRFRERDGDVNYRRQPVLLPYQHRPNFVLKSSYDQEEVENSVDEDEDEEVDDGGRSHFSRACGLIPNFCLKSSFLLLNPVPGMKVRGRLPPRSRIKVSDHGSLGQVQDEHSWEAVYKYKVGRDDNASREDVSKLTSESNQRSSWSDSQTADGSSYRHSPQSPFHDGKGLLRVPTREPKGRKTVSFDSFDRVGENFGKIRPLHGKGSGSMSLSIDRTLYVDSVNMMDTPSSMSSSGDAVADTNEIMNPADKNSDVVIGSMRMEYDPVLETCEKDVLQPETSTIVESGLSSSSETSKFPVALKVENEEKSGASLALALLPPPLPKSPSESWLQRTLPSISSKNPSPQSFLGIQVQRRKQASWGSSYDLKYTSDARALKAHPQLTRFAEVRTKPSMPRYET